MSYLLPHLPSGWHVDEAIKSEEDRIVVIRFGHDWDTQCMTMDETLYGVAEKISTRCTNYLGTGNNNKINWAMDNKQEMIDIIETVYRGASKGRGLVVSPKDYSTRYRY
ncbi:hypothetical protein H2248_009056 [Termitomyces sp. 'cryptogamus']|nr:hypothetical protein H2248_009056 [Termitomyces sp. 'cryptogamus']